MATVNRVYILIAFILSAIASIFNFVSIGTEEWITGSSVWLNGTGDVNYVHYGLFQGTYKRIVPFSTTYQLTMTCSFKNNICALLCELDAEEREAILDSLISNTYDPNYAYANCAGISKFTSGLRSFESTPVRANSDTYVTSKSFINAGVWLSTLLFVVLAALLGLWTSVLALINTVHNPYQYFLRMGITSLAHYAGSIAILYYREYLNERDPKQQKVTLQTDAADPMIQTMKHEPEFLNYWMWLGTVLALCLGLLVSIISAVLAIINTVTTSYRCLVGMSGLIFWNLLTTFFSLIAIALWMAQFFTKIQYNVLSREDRNNEWTSEDMAELGYSFWFVVGASGAAVVNIILVTIATSEKETETVIPVLEEKTNGAIMLY
ncbi:hypothetical protein YQE_04348, partial [Dendroctonus ponderosae]